MLAFKMKKPQQEMGLERLLQGKIDDAKWGASGRDLIAKLDGMRGRMKEASQSYSEKGAEECREVFGRYQALAYKANFVCEGVDLKPLPFKWADAFDTSEVSSISDWNFERACVIFNLAAAISYLATHCDRGTAEGLKTACQLYQQSAGALHEVHELVKAGAWSATADLASDTIQALESLMLAQAQKCFFEKAEGDGMKHKVLAMLSAECAALYGEVSLRIDEAKSRSRPISAMTAEWLDVVQWNKFLFEGLQAYYAAQTNVDAAEYGIALSRYTYATDQCARAVNACKQASPALQEVFQKWYAICKEAHTKMKKDNDNIYYEKVPDYKTLDPPERKCMVKPNPPVELGNLEDPVPLMGSLSVSEPPPPPFAAAEAAGVEQLVAMGFAKDKAEEALKKSGGSVQVAADLLVQQGI